MLWASPVMAGRSSAAEVRWDKGLPVHAVQFWKVGVQAAEPLPHWQLGEEGPQEDEASFCSADWGHHFEQRRAEWNEAMAGQRVDQVWSVLEDTLVNCHRLNSSGFQRPRGRTVTKAEEAPQDPYSGEVYTQAARAAQHRKRILQQLLILHGRPGREEAVKQLRTALCRDPAPEWAVWGTFPLTQTWRTWSKRRAQPKTRLSESRMTAGGDLGRSGAWLNLLAA